MPGSGEQRKPWPRTHPHLAQLTTCEKATSDLLTALFAEPALLKLGFAFHNDLHALVNSFPHLPVFAALPVRLRTPRRVPPPPPPLARRTRPREPPAAADSPAAAGKRSLSAGGGGATAETHGSDAADAATQGGACAALPGFELCSFINMNALEGICRRRQAGRRQESLNSLAKRCDSVACERIMVFGSMGRMHVRAPSEVVAGRCTCMEHGLLAHRPPTGFA